MPIYEYVCDDCKNPYEKIVLSKSTQIACPKCGSEHNTMRFSVVKTNVKGDSGNMPSGGGFSGGGGCGSGCGCQ